jgi:hypothetical protein
MQLAGEKRVRIVQSLYCCHAGCHSFFFILLSCVCIKRTQFVLFPPDFDADCLVHVARSDGGIRVPSPCVPYPIRHAHDRQSQVNDCEAPDASRFSAFARLGAWQGVLRAGDLLYIVRDGMNVSPYAARSQIPCLSFLRLCAAIRVVARVLECRRERVGDAALVAVH